LSDYRSNNSNNGKKNYPAKRKYNHPKQYHSKNIKPANPMQGFFNGNLAQNMNFGGNNHDLSGYVERTVMVRDRYGNVQKMREKQFFNSGKNLGRVTAHDDESKFY
jgi:hypothetical protein